MGEDDSTEITQGESQWVDSANGLAGRKVADGVLRVRFDHWRGLVWLRGPHDSQKFWPKVQAA